MPAEADVSDFRDLTVLIVDDDPVTVDFIAEALRSLGVERVHSAGNGRDALLLVDRETDVVICDLNMPEMDGMVLMGALARRPFRGALILASGEGSQILRSAGELAAAHSLPLLGVMTKPITPEQIGTLLAVYQPDSQGATVATGPTIDTPSLRAAIAGGRMVVYYQPKVELATRQIIGYEALVRWLDPVHGVIPPDSFIPLAEDSGLIHPLTRAVIERVLADLPRLPGDPGREPNVAVNLSAVSLHDAALPDQIAGMVAAAGLTPARLLLEITETRLLDDLPITLEVISRLRLKRFSLSIDDFGTGYSGMQHLGTLPLSELKVDKSFVQSAPRDSTARAIVEAAVELSRKLVLKVVAEGVETKEQWDLMRALGLRVAQGYYIARPMPFEQVGEWWTGWQAEGEPETGSRPPSQVYDPAALAAIIGDDRSKRDHFVAAFVDQADARRRPLSDAIRAGDATAIRGLAHQLKSTARGVGAGELGEICLRLESACEAADLATAANLLLEFDAAMARFRAAAGSA